MNQIVETVFDEYPAGCGFPNVKLDGEVWPCLFVEVTCGNVCQTPCPDIWSNAPVLEGLRERTGGPRGRAWAATGDHLAENPSFFFH